MNRWCAYLLMLGASVGVAACSSEDGSDDRSIERADGPTEVPSSLAGGSASDDGTGIVTETTVVESGTGTETGIGSVTVDVPAVAVHLDVQATGNRVVEGPADLTGPPDLDISVGSDVEWVFGLGGGDADRRWVVIDAAGTVQLVDPDGGTVALADIGDDVPVVVEVDDQGRVDVRTVGDRTRIAGPAVRFDDPLPDTRIVIDDRRGRVYALGGPTDRYRHGVLGDVLEASTVERAGLAGAADADADATTIIEIPSPDVIEAVSPMLADVDEDGRLDILVTLANADVGARLAAFDADGELLAESDPVGLGNRWRNLLAVAPVGPNGEVEVVDVLTPHIGGVVQFHRLDEATGRLDRVAATAEYSTHAIGSRNLDLGIVVDADGDGQLDVVIPTQDRSTLVAITRTADEDGIDTSARFDLGSRMTSNLAATPRPDGTVDLAIATADGRLLAWYGS